MKCRTISRSSLSIESRGSAEWLLAMDSGQIAEQARAIAARAENALAASPREAWVMHDDPS